MAVANRIDVSRRRTRALAVLAMLALLTGSHAHAADEPAGRIERIEVKTDDPSAPKVILMLSQPLAFHVRVFNGEGDRKSTQRLVLDFDNTTLGPDAASAIEVGNALVQKIRPGQFTARAARIVLDLASDAKHAVEAYETPPHVTIAITGTGTAAAEPTATTPPVLFAPH